MSNHPPEHPGTILRRFQRTLRKSGADSHIHIFADNAARNHITIEAVRIKISLTVTVAGDGQLVITTADQTRHIRATQDSAISIITALARKEPA